MGEYTRHLATLLAALKVEFSSLPSNQLQFPLFNVSFSRACLHDDLAVVHH
jgi:hypothetical protein